MGINKKLSRKVWKTNKMKFKLDSYEIFCIGFDYNLREKENRLSPYVSLKEDTRFENSEEDIDLFSVDE